MHDVVADDIAPTSGGRSPRAVSLFYTVVYLEVAVE